MTMFYCRYQPIIGRWTTLKFLPRYNLRPRDYQGLLFPSQNQQAGLEMDLTGEAEKRQAEEQLAMVNGGEMREAGFNWQQLERQSQDREGSRDFLKDLCCTYGDTEN